MNDPDVPSATVRWRALRNVSELCTVALTVAEGCPVEHVLAAPDLGA
jgi:hypothetical protein